MNKHIENRIEALNGYLDNKQWDRATECIQSVCVDYANEATPITELYMVKLCTRGYESDQRAKINDDYAKLVLALKQLHKMYAGETQLPAPKLPRPSFKNSNNLIKSQADKRGAQIVHYLNDITGGLWQMRVWNNLGWHYEVYCGNITIHETVRVGQEPRYGAFVGDKMGDDGCSAMPVYLSSYLHYHHPTPEQALMEGLNALKNHAEMMLRAHRHNLSRLDCVSVKELLERITKNKRLS